jgi:hypothetical protein
MIGMFRSMCGFLLGAVDPAVLGPGAMRHFLVDPFSENQSG